MIGQKANGGQPDDQTPRRSVLKGNSSPVLTPITETGHSTDKENVKKMSTTTIESMAPSFPSSFDSSMGGIVAESGPAPS